MSESSKVTTDEHNGITTTVIRPGWKTTEFAITVLVSVLGALLASGLIPTGHWAGQVAGAIMTALSSLGYSVSRGNAKVPPLGCLLAILALPLMVAGCTGLTTEQRGVVTGVGGIVAKTGTGFAAAKGHEWCLKQYEANKDDALLKLCEDLVDIAKTAADYGVKKGLASIPEAKSAPCPIPAPVVTP